MRVLALDPSTTCTGFAVLEGLSCAGLLDGGLVRPSGSARACRGHEPGWLGGYLVREEAGLAAYRRVMDTLAEVEGLVSEFSPGVVVVEVPSGKTGTGAKNGARGSLTTYGMSAGAVWAACRVLMPGRVVPVTERVWTRGLGGKAKRQARLARLYAGRYAAGDDAGGDTADAIGVGRWWLESVASGRYGLDSGVEAE